MSFYPTPRPMSLGWVPNGVGGVKATLAMMVKLARQWDADPGIIELAGSLVRGVPQGDKMGRIRALHAFVRDHITYVNDPVGIELLRTPKDALELGVGDCDDKSLLLATLLRAIGHPARFVALKLGQSSDFSHVLVETPVGKGWLPLETILDVVPGWYPPNVTQRMVANI